MGNRQDHRAKAEAVSARDKTGGPAFPSIIYDRAIDPDPRVCFATMQGMTLRDFFAAMALQGYIATMPSNATYRDAAEKAYRVADAMIDERENHDGAQ